MKPLERCIEKLKEKVPAIEPFTIKRIFVDKNGNEVGRMVRAMNGEYRKETR